jgi:D-beta-D-heptose 7-phosphate kinase/D-beta-D-heptose 1-phosphate adenosyltransferase
MNNYSQIVRVDYEKNNFKIENNSKLNLFKKINIEIKKTDVIIISDYNKGLLTYEIIKKIIDLGKKYNKIIVADPKKDDFKYYKGTDIVTPNLKEFLLALSLHRPNENTLIQAAKKACKEFDIKEILLTRSEKGMMLISPKYYKNYKAMSKEIFDVTGAGDTVIALVSLFKGIGLDTKTSVMISNIAAGIVVGKSGASTTNILELSS